MSFVTASARDRRALLLGALIVAPVLAGNFVVRPCVSLLIDRRAALESDRALLGREIRAARELSRAAEISRLGTVALITALPRLFDGSNAVTASAELGRYVSSRATANGLVVEQVETQTRLDSARGPGAAESLGMPAERSETPRDLRVGIRVKGRITAIYSFLRALENGPKLVRVEAIQIARASAEDTSDGTLVLTATIAGLARRSFAIATADSEEAP